MWPCLSSDPHVVMLCPCDLTPRPPAPVTLQVARAGRFGTKGLAITFVSDENDAKILNDVQDRFEVNVAELPEEIDISTYSKCWGQGWGLGPDRGPLPRLTGLPSVCLTVEQSR